MSDDIMRDEEIDEEDQYIKPLELIDNQIFDRSVSCTYNSKGEFLEYFGLGSFQHKLLFTSKSVCDDVNHGYDPISGLVVKKLTFQREIKQKRSIALRNNLNPVFDQLHEQIQSLKEDKCLLVPTHISLLLKYVQNDPDMFYFGRYNWYYTGGTLKTVGNEGNHLLLFVEKTDKDSLCVAPLKRKKSWRIDKSQIVRTVPCLGQEIFQVIGIENSYLIGVRQKFACTLYSRPLNNEENLLQEHFKVNSHVPFTSFDISSVHSELCTINVESKLLFWDINGNNLPMVRPFLSDNSPHDRWHSLWYSCLAPSMVVVASRKSMKWTDRRSKRIANGMELRCVSGIEEDEEISVHFESKCNANGVYIGTDESLVLMDVRMLEVPVHRWSHRMILPPLYSSIISLSEGKEIACIANHYPGDVVLAFSTPDHSYPLVELPSRLDSLLSFQAKGSYLDPSLRPRIAPGISGLATISSSGSLDTEVLTQSRTSDIFSQAVFKSDFDTSLNSNDKYFRVLSTKEEKLNATGRWDMSKLYESFSNSNFEFLKSRIPMQQTPKTNQKWQWDIEDLSNYKDVLSSIILDEWDDVISAQKKLTPNIEKVSAWLDSLTNKDA